MFNMEKRNRNKIIIIIIIKADLWWSGYTSMLLGRKATNRQNKLWISEEHVEKS